MTDIHVAVSNYRCFGGPKAAEFDLVPGLVAFVGPNNAGKSAILRLFWELRGLFGLFSTGEQLQAGSGVPGSFGLPMEDIGQIFHDGNTEDLILEISVKPGRSSGGPAVERVVIRIPRGTNTFTTTLYVRRKAIGPIHHWSDHVPYGDDGAVLGDPGPMVDAFALLARIRYVGARRAATSQATGQDFDSITGSNFISRWRNLHGGQKGPRGSAREIEKRLASLFGFPDLTMTVSENGQDLIVGLNDETYRIDELGSGIGHFAVALLTIAESGGASWLLVDEPENGLHPSLQLEFLRAAAAGASDGVCIATHNYGLARQAAARIYLVRRPKGRRYSELVAAHRAPSLAELLGEMGYSGYRDLGYDRLLLVEGPNDVRVVDELRRLIEPKANVLILPVGGSDTINRSAGQQLGEIARLAPKIYALIDSERSAPDQPLAAGRIAFLDACEQLGIVSHVLDRRAMENYLTQGAVSIVLGPDALALEPYEPASAQLKDRQRDIAARMTLADLQGTDLLGFLRKVYLTSGR